MGARRCLLLILLACTCLSVRSIAQNCSLSAPQKLAAMQLTNLFENGNFEFNYGKLRGPAVYNTPALYSATVVTELLSQHDFVQDIARISMTGVALQRDLLASQQQMVSSPPDVYECRFGVSSC